MLYRKKWFTSRLNVVICSMKRIQLPILFHVVFIIVSFFSKETILVAQALDEIQTSNFYKKDSLNLGKYYPKPTITAVEILAGPSLAKIKGVDQSLTSIGNSTYYATTPMNLTGFSFGIGLIHSFTKNFEIQTRVFWERKGAKQKTDSITLSLASGSVTSTGPRSMQSTKSDYFTFSVVPQLLLGKRSHFNLGIGAYFGVLQNSRVVIQYINPTPYLVRLQGAFNEDDYGLSLNAGYTFFSKNITRFTVQFSGSYGLKQISTFHDLYSFAPPLYNRSFSIFLGVRLMNNPKRANQ